MPCRVASAMSMSTRRRDSITPTLEVRCRLGVPLTLRCSDVPTCAEYARSAYRDDVQAAESVFANR